MRSAKITPTTAEASMRGDHREHRTPLMTAALAAMLAVVAAVGLASWPCAYSGESITGSPAGSTRTSTCSSIIEVNGAGVLVVLAVPVVLASLAVVAAWLGAKTFGWAVATVLALFSLAAGFTVGLFFLPAAALALIGMFRWSLRDVREKLDTRHR